MKQKTNTNMVDISNVLVTTHKNGITLISLIITIIVLLILATVAISIALDSNGLFARARKAAEDWNTSVIDEERTVENVFEILNEINVGGTIGGGEIQPPEPPANKLPEGWNKEYVSDIVEDEESGKKAPIPEGYVASDVEGENKIEDGLVIYEGTDSVKDDSDAMETRNQYVWIPVENINNMVMCQTCGASGTLKYDETNNTLQCITCNAGENTKLAGKLYATSADETTDFTDSKCRFNNTLTGQKYQNSTLREPANLEDTAVADASKQGIIAIKEILEKAYTKNTYQETYDSIKDDWLQLQQENFDNIAKSVARYKGFYISRYEIQEEGGTKKGCSVKHLTWYELYNLAKKTNKSTSSHMIWGSQYDQVMKFIDGKNGFYVKESNSNRHRSSILNSGSNNSDLVCNIYDLEGNYFEWTAEAESNQGRIYRGGSIDGYKYPTAGRRNNTANGSGYNRPTYSGNRCTTRATLYINT